MLEQNASGTVNCFSCHRPNSPAAIRCLWCGAQFQDATSATNAAILQAEFTYLGGFDRLDSPQPVTLRVTSEGVEIREMMPGTRTVQIPAAAILEARVVRNIDKVRVDEAIPWWRKLFFDDETNQKNLRKKEEILREYIVTMRYRSEDKILNVAFRRDDDMAAVSAEKLAKTINSILKTDTAEVP
jgi:hypothetical protein